MTGDPGRTTGTAGSPALGRPSRVAVVGLGIMGASIAGNLAAAGIALLDCPISGTGAQARHRGVAVHASGDAAARQRCTTIVAGFARASQYVGAFGHGKRLKLVANLLVTIPNVATAEAIGLAVRAALDPMRPARCSAPAPPRRRSSDCAGR